MTLTNKQLVTVIILPILCVLALFFGICSCLPVMEYGEYEYYNSAINLIQGDSMFSNSVSASYTVKLDKESDTTIKEVASVIAGRLGSMYGRYFTKVAVVDGDKIEITLSKTANSEKTSETSILSAVTSTGKVEVLDSSTYAESSVLFNYSNLYGFRTRSYAYADSNYYIVEMKLNKAGMQIAKDKNMNTTSTYYIAIDGTVTYAAQYSSTGKLQAYTSSTAESDRLIGLTKSGPLDAKLTTWETNDVSSSGGLVFGIIMAVLIIGTWVFYAVRYKLLAVAAIVSQLLAIVIFIMFAGLVYFNLLNLASVFGIILGYGLMSAFTCLPFEKIRAYSQEKTFAASRHIAFRDWNKWNCIAHAIALVLGIVLWLIPTGVTAPLGNALVYSAVLSFGVTMGLNRLFSDMIGSFIGESANAR